MSPHAIDLHSLGLFTNRFCLQTVHDQLHNEFKVAFRVSFGIQTRTKINMSQKKFSVPIKVQQRKQNKGELAFIVRKSSKSSATFGLDGLSQTSSNDACSVYYGSQLTTSLGLSLGAQKSSDEQVHVGAELESNFDLELADNGNTREPDLPIPAAQAPRRPSVASDQTQLPKKQPPGNKPAEVKTTKPKKRSSSEICQSVDLSTKHQRVQTNPRVSLQKAVTSSGQVDVNDMSSTDIESIYNFQLSPESQKRMMMKSNKQQREFASRMKVLRLIHKTREEIRYWRHRYENVIQDC